jgi:hypothetical protein
MIFVDVEGFDMLFRGNMTIKQGYKFFAAFGCIYLVNFTFKRMPMYGRIYFVWFTGSISLKFMK